MSTLLDHARVITPDGVLGDGWVLVHDAAIAQVGQGSAPGTSTVVDLAGCWLAPGYVDVHMHGGGGHDGTASPEDMAAAASFHCTRGSTSTLISLVAAPVEALEEQLRWAAKLTADPDSTVIGAHLEGPFLSHVRCGAQDPDALLLPDVAVFHRLADAADGALRTITIAPELPGAIELIRAVVARGVVASIGHTDADYDHTLAAIDAGATAATHLFNAMPPLTHRAPGAVGVVLTAGLACEVINDGVHTHPSLCAVVAERPGRLVLITDAISAAGQPDGDYQLGGRRVVVRNGAARLPGTDTLAGSTLTLDDAVRRAVRESGLSVAVAVGAASTTPARAIGAHDRGRIAAGCRADVVVLGEDLDVQAVMHGGDWVDQPAF